jgi:hypothetical protein
MPVAVHRRSDTPGSASPGLFNLSRGFPEFHGPVPDAAVTLLLRLGVGCAELCWGRNYAWVGTTNIAMVKTVQSGLSESFLALCQLRWQDCNDTSPPWGERIVI